MKVPLQDKVAELEQRIVKLEEAQKYAASLNRTYIEQVQGYSLFGKHWKRLWEEFELTMKEVFK